MAHLVLYDGVCGLCDRFVRFLLRIDGRDRLRFAALQGPIGTEILKEAGRAADAMSTVIVVKDHGSTTARLLYRSDAALFAVASTGGIWGLASAFRMVPRFLRDAIYDLIARTRYRIFGRLESCPIPKPETRAKFLDFARPGGGH